MKKKNYFYLLFTISLLVGSNFGWYNYFENKTTLTGTVLDEEGKAIISGMVALEQAGKIIQTAQTDFNGLYSIENLTPGNYDVSFSYVGFQTLKIKSIEIIKNKSNVLNATMSQGVFLADCVVIGYRKPLIEVDNVTSGGIVTAEEIGRLPVKNVDDIAGSTAGVAISQKRKGKTNKRGSRNGNTSIILDGIRVSGNNIPQSAINQLQIATGGTEAQYSHVTRGNISIANHDQENKTTKVVQSREKEEPLLNYHEVIEDNNKGNYNVIIENPFFSPIKEPLSTFSIDVDRASYANVRRYINEGVKPPKNAVRIEEMINYFEYEYAQPKGKHPFAVETQLGDCPWNEYHQLLHIGVQGKTVKQDKLPPSNLVFLVDVSGSMSSRDKLPLLISGFKMMVQHLTKKDKVSIVVYAGAAGVVLEPTTGDQKTKIITALENLNAGGSTAGGAGIQLAYKLAKDNFLEDGNNRVLLATDGDFNVGTSKDASLVEMIEKERKSGVFLSVLGFGRGNYMDSKMQQLADSGNGNHAYIDNLKEAQKILVHEINGTLHTIAKDVKIQIEFNPAFVESYRLIGYENRMLNKEDFNDDTKDAGEIGSGHSVTAIYEIIPVGSKSPFLSSVDPLRFQKNEETTLLEKGQLAWVKFRYKEPKGTKSIKFEQGIEYVNKEKQLANNNFDWTTSVVEFGLLLRDSKYKYNSQFSKLISRAEAAKGIDKEGYRSEFIQLVKSYASLNDTAQK